MADTAAVSAEPDFESLAPKLTPLTASNDNYTLTRPSGPLIVLIASAIVFSFINARFYASANISLMLQQVAVIAALGVAQTLIILTAGIDLSIGAAMILAQLFMAQVAANNHVPGLLALLIGFAGGAGDRCGQRRAGDAVPAPTVHRHAGHVEHLHLDRPAVRQGPDDPGFADARACSTGPATR